MLPADVADLVRGLASLPAETPYCEFKKGWDDPDNIGKLVSAISNSACLEGERQGYVVWGVENQTHKIVGTDFEPSKKLTKGQELQLWLAQRLAPSLNFSFCECELEGLKVVVLQVPAATEVTTKFNHIAYIRIGSATPKLSDYPKRETALTLALHPFIWEKGVAASNLTPSDVFALLHVERYFELMKLPRPTSEIETLNRLGHHGIIDVEHRAGKYLISNCGAALFARKLDAFPATERKLPRVVIYSGKSKVETLKERDGTFGYASGFHGLIKYIMDALPQVERIHEGFRKIVTSYHEDMIRESVANALIHQDFTITGASPLIEIFKDRVEITNPGKPVIELSRFIDLPGRSRNEALAKLMRYMDICEERGSGIDKIIAAAESHTLPAPDFRIDGDNMRVILYGPRPFRDTTSSERVRAAYHHAVMCFIANNRMTNASLRVRLGIDERNAAQVSRILAQAQEERLVKQGDSWSARSGSYVPIWA